MNIQEIVNEHSRKIIKNIFSKLDDKEKYVILELNNQLQDKINKIDNTIEYINKHCVNEKVSKEVGYKCYTMADTNELEHIMKLLGDKEDE